MFGRFYAWVSRFAGFYDEDDHAYCECGARVDYDGEKWFHVGACAAYHRGDDNDVFSFSFAS